MKPKVPTLCALLLLAAPLAVQGQFNYFTENGTITISGYTGPGGAVNIPAQIDGLPVTSISYGGFAGRESLTSVTIPDSVTYIGDYAFYDCVNLTSVTIPNSVTNIGAGAFDECGHLTSVTIPSGVIGWGAFDHCVNLTNVFIGNSVSVIAVGDLTFAGCDNLRAITVAAQNPVYSSLNGVLFNKSQTTLVGFPPGLSGTYTIPNSVTNIGDSAFSGCLSLTNVTMGNSVSNIGVLAFYACVSLTSVMIPDSVTGIGATAFGFCHSLTNVTMGSSVMSIGPYVFSDCYNLTSVVIPDSVTSIGDHAFYRCQRLASVTTGNGVNNINSSLFSGCDSLAIVTIGNSVTNIATDAFTSSTNLTAFMVAALNPVYSSLNGVLFDKNQTQLVLFPGGLGGNYVIPDSVSSIGSSAFYNCSGLTNVTIGNSVTNMVGNPFVQCSSLNAITVAAQNAVYSTLNGVLFDKNQTALLVFPEGIGGSYAIPNSVTSIGESAFYDCYNLIGVTIPNGVTSIGDSAFYYCYNLTDATIPNSVTSIGAYAFGGCYGLTNVVMGTGVTSIGDFAFEYCNGLTSVIIPNSVTTIGNSAFYSCSRLTDATIGNGVTDIGYDAFAYCNSLTRVTIGSGIISIGDGAFSECPGLTTVYFGGDAPLYVGWDNFVQSTIGLPILDSATVYYLPGTSGWSNTFAGLPTVMLNGPPQLGTTAEGWNYVSDGVQTIVAGYTGPENEVDIPPAIAGLPVTRIAAFAFRNSGLTSVTIPDSVIDIGDYAFQQCHNLTNVTIGSGVMNIGDAAFVSCYSLTSVSIGGGVTNIGDAAFDASGLTTVAIPDSVTTIGDYAFGECYSLTNITVAAGNPVYRSDNGVLFDKAQMTLIQFPGGRSGNYAIPDGVTSIGNNAFSFCPNLTSVTIPNSVTNIGEAAFYDCTSLSAVFFMGNAPTIGVAAFSSISFETATIYYLPGTVGWSNTVAGRPAVMWFLPQPLILNHGPGFGVQSNQFGFTISWATNVPVVVEAATSLSNPVWIPVSTNTLVGGTSYFSDAAWTHFPQCFYRLTTP